MHEGRSKGAVIEILGPAAGAQVQQDMVAGVHRVLRLDHDLSGFYAKAAHDPDLAWAATGAGRMLQGPTVFEDVVKTVCTTNCAWSATVRMVNAMVEHLGDPAVGGTGSLGERVPDARDDGRHAGGVLSGRGPRGLPRSRTCARWRARVADGDLDLEALATATPDELPDDELERQLLALPGRGTVRRRAHHDDDRPELPVDPRFVDAAEVRAPGRKDAPSATHRSGGGSRATAITRDWRSGCS